MQPNAWVLDIETKPMIAYVWDRKDVQIALNQIKEDWSVLAWSAKKLDDPPSKTVYYDLRHAKDLTDDRSILRPLWKLLDETDILITQNGAHFDARKLNARFIELKMGKPSNYEHWDTYLCARRVAAFTSNKLEYLTEKLNTKYKKQSHSEFPGQSLWTECLKGNIKAWNAMKKYNIYDVLSTEEAFHNLYEWAPKAFPRLNANKCVSCGKMKKIKIKCNDCGTWGDK